MVITFPAKTAKGWLTDRLEKKLNAGVSIEELGMRWNFGLRLKGISILQVPGAGGRGSEEKPEFNIKIDSLNVNPNLFSLLRFKPEVAFRGQTPSGGDFSGSYAVEGLSLSFKDILFKDFTVSSLPVPSTAMFSGSGRFKLVKGKGTIEIEVNGIPGGKQRFAAPAGEGAGLDGKLKITASLPGLS